LPCGFDFKLNARLVRKGQQENLRVWRQGPAELAGQSNGKKRLSGPGRCDDDLMADRSVADRIVIAVRLRLSAHA
jgi:hypothetical protein